MRALPAPALVLVFSLALALPATAQAAEAHEHDADMVAKYGSHYEHIVFDSGPIMAGGGWNHTFHLVGTYAYHCHPHPDMTGVVHVDASSNVSSARVRVANFTFTPANLTLAPGAEVVFENADGVEHTVTFVAYDGPALPRKTGIPGPGLWLTLAGGAVAVATRARRILK